MCSLCRICSSVRGLLLLCSLFHCIVFSIILLLCSLLCQYPIPLPLQQLLSLYITIVLSYIVIVFSMPNTLAAVNKNTHTHTPQVYILEFFLTQTIGTV